MKGLKLLPVLALAGAFLIPAPAAATWSVIAIDLRSGQVVVASATCVLKAALRRFPSAGLKDIQAIVVPGRGVAVAQAGVDATRANQTLIHRELQAGTAPEAILELLREDPQIERRQFAILDREGRSAGFTGERNSGAALGIKGIVPDEEILFSIQGNILASDAVVQRAARALLEAEGTLADRVMAAMEAADAAGGDRRCTCETAPVPDGVPCTGRTSHVAYLLVAEPDDRPGSSFNDGDWSLFINVTDENIIEGEDANPVVTLRQRYDRWREEHAPPGQGLRRAEFGLAGRYEVRSGRDGVPAGTAPDGLSAQGGLRIPSVSAETEGVPSHPPCWLHHRTISY